MGILENEEVASTERSRDRSVECQDYGRVQIDPPKPPVL
ncbi:hypothetical protein Ppha_0937 [Pelodictyon phaeoclathratiforme BU-1]|uniref:Uncharacterized protein n=1 Tax=Pelodictyon phaeoclathratiforme (strain DSM 5477 / BU-1) TaxID=324925 RepID=B4SF77_PELPB|nr:hypothetical protein Ppha_0937 [Pelodictyon phaeoclathratiforme BU-1]